MFPLFSTYVSKQERVPKKHSALQVDVKEIKIILSVKKRNTNVFVFKDTSRKRDERNLFHFFFSKKNVHPLVLGSSMDPICKK